LNHDPRRYGVVRGLDLRLDLRKHSSMVQADGSVVCRLRLRFGEEWIVKVDVGSPSEQPDGGDRLKAAFSDALKRVAVKFGIGRYLYRLPSVWCDWDAKAKRFTKQPQLPPWAVPQKANKTVPVEANTDAKANTFPEDGIELERRLASYEKTSLRGV
jgi:hypothetical protein